MLDVGCWLFPRLMEGSVGPLRQKLFPVPCVAIAAFLVLCCVNVVGLAQNADPNALHAGPLFDHFDLTLAPGERTEAAGPFYYSERQDTQRTLAVPPLFAHVVDPATDSEEFDFLYPVVGYDRFGEQYRFHIFQLLSFAGGASQEESYRSRFTLFPIYFQQRSPLPDENYTAVLPFYGHLKHRLFRDEIFFVMFPFYIQSRKADVVTDNYVYPFFDVRRGDGLRGWQLWPFYGVEHKTVTTSTNGFGDVQTIPGHDNLFVLWPFFFREKAGIGSDNPEWTEGSIPAFSLFRSPRRDSTTVLWPFFSRVDDREKKYREWDVPWPFVVFARGSGKTTTRVFPFFSHARSTYLESDFYLWPFYKYDRIHADPADRRRTRILFFLYSDIDERNTETGGRRHWVACLPLFSFRQELNGTRRLQVIALTETYLPNSKSMDRDWEPLWSFWRSERNPKTGAANQSLLWNLYRHDSRPGFRRTSMLFGLFQSRTDAKGNHVRVCYVPVRK